MALATASPWGLTAFVPPSTSLRGQSKLGSDGVEQHITAEPELNVGATSQNKLQSATIVAGMVGSACLLARRKPVTKKVTVRAAFDTELGATKPFNYWDPLGLSTSGDEAEFRRRRVAEIKNGRVAMFACIGYMVPEFWRFPGYCSPSQDLKFADIPNGVEALYKVPVEGWAQIGIFCACLELFPLRQEKNRMPGDTPGCGYLGIPWFAFGRPGTECDPVKSERSLNAEINNGRLAMIAITGMVFQNCTFGGTGAMWGFGAFENELGVQPPVGFWDPLGFCDDGDEFDFRRRRCVEIKHGRVSMLACIGYIVPEYFKWPGYISPSTGLKFSDIPHGLAAITKVPAVGWQQITFFGLAMELFAMNQKATDPPGKLSSRLVFGLTDISTSLNTYTWGPYGIPNAPSIEDPEKRKRSLNAEIANGRLAMFAIMAMMFQNGTVGTTGPEMWLPPAGAFENELGVQPPMGFWDPLGFCDDGDEVDFRRRRCVEIKHGRVCMLACIGYIVPEYFKWPGYISPSTGLKFSDIPHGLAAITKVPAVGWMQITFFGLAMELFAMNNKATDPPGKLSSRLVFGLTDISTSLNTYTWGPYGIPNAPSIEDPEKRKRSLNAEIANGRLAMFAIMAMMFQNGTVGTTGPEMWLPPAP